MSDATIPISDRLWPRLRQSANGCWEYTATRNEHGYGIIGYKGRKARAHRVAFELAKGPIPDGLVVMHTCDNPPCCNPDHLVVGTKRDNSRDMAAKGRTGTRRGLDNNKARLTFEEIEAIRDAYAKGETYSEISRRLGLNNAYIGKLCKGLARVAS